MHDGLPRHNGINVKIVAVANNFNEVVGVEEMLVTIMDNVLVVKLTNVVDSTLLVALAVVVNGVVVAVGRVVEAIFSSMLVTGDGVIVIEVDELVVCDIR